MPNFMLMPIYQVKSLEAERVFPSVKEPRSSLTPGSRFFNDPRKNTSEEPAQPATPTSKIPTKPPRVTVTAKVIKPDQPVAPERKSTEDIPTKPPRRNIPPAKPPRVQNSESVNNEEGEAKVKQSSVTISLKRPAPVPPSDDTTGNNGLYRYVTRTNVSFFDPSPNDQRTEHSCA